MTRLIQGDCLEVMQDIPDGTVDLVLTDPPYGTMKGAPIDSWLKNGDCCDWDNIIDIPRMYAECARVLRPNGRCVLFSQEPYTSALITQAIAPLPFNYRALWLKNIAGNSLMSKVAMVNLYEDINIFTKRGDDYEGANPLRAYFKKVMEYIGATSAKDINKELGHRKAEHAFYVSQAKRVIKETVGGRADHTTRVGSSQFTLCTEPVYNELIEKLHIDRMTGFKPYAELRQIQDKFSQSISPVFNLWQGRDSKSNVLRYDKELESVHPTQKPVALLDDLIKTFSNHGDTVLDFTMGSGSTGCACVETGREFIGIERDAHYFTVAQDRIKRAEAERELDLFKKQDLQGIQGDLFAKYTKQ